ncbi:MAG: aminopeptidase P N-terminal domain-containing protein, partial [Bdellovibrionales bacterium]|nr:aminopeptidase P N-terminal domain-containing protein [Bdellovibrionales bacterium]
MRKALENVQIFKQRREKVLKNLGNNAMVVAAHPELIRNNDVHYSYRQDSNMYYLTGFEEPESVLILRPGNFPESVLFVRQKNLERETWDGFRFGPELAQQEFQVDKCYPIEEFEKQAVELLKGYEGVYYRLLKNPTFDQKFLNVLDSLRAIQGRTGY